MSLGLFDAEGLRLLTFHVERAALGLSAAGDTATVELDADLDGPEPTATLLVYPSKPQEYRFCNDVSVSTDPTPEKWSVTGGSVTITLETTPQNESYKVTASFSALIARSPSGLTQPLPDFKISNVLVGWLPG